MKPFPQQLFAKLPQNWRKQRRAGGTWSLIIADEAREDGNRVHHLRVWLKNSPQISHKATMHFVFLCLCISYWNKKYWHDISKEFCLFILHFFTCYIDFFPSIFYLSFNIMYLFKYLNLYFYLTKYLTFYLFTYLFTFIFSFL